MQRSLASRIGNGLLLCAMSDWGGRALAATQLPVPCVGVSCGANASGFVSTGAATAVQSGKTLTVSQSSTNATLNWSSFNISADGKVVFQQPSGTSTALNRIWDSNPSSIFGALTANGQIYLINANGFVFGATSTVNVAGLIASSLNITPTTFSEGILEPVLNSAPALQQFTDASGNPILNTGSITVQAGAQLTAANSGRLLLAAPTITNGGSLAAPDGQIVLAAGQNVYLQASDQPDLRGLVVEVDAGTGAAQQLQGQPTVSNLAQGQLSAPRGNITLVGLAVNQDGRISATTTVAANGSVTLEAAGGLVNSGSNSPITASIGGTLTIGPDSIVDVLPEYSDTTTAVAAQTQLQSAVNLTGQQVLIHGGVIDAPSGALTVLAATAPSTGVPPSGYDPASKIRIDPGTVIDLAGSDADLPMSANLVTVQLRSNEFADDPTQRNGALRGTTVTIDVRADGGLGTPIADVGSAIAAVGQNIAQRTEAGGTATFLSGGDVVFNPGASIDVSGGQSTYEAGTIQTTQLVGANGKLYDIGTANPLLTYTGVVNPTFTATYNKWGVTQVVPTPGLSQYESSYVEGAAAGSIQFAAPSLVLDGTLKGTAVNGPYQRGPVGAAFGDAVPGGTLSIGYPLGASPSVAPNLDYLAPSIALSATTTPIVVADAAALPPQTLQLPAAYLTSDGFTNATIYSNTSVTLPAGLPLQLLPGAVLQVVAPVIDIGSNISSLGGTLSFESTTSIASLLSNQPRLGIEVGEGATLNVSGQWTNDSVLAGGVGSAPTWHSGGTINLQLTEPGGQLVLGGSVALEANGGAWLRNGGSVTYGAGGKITLDASPAQAALQFGPGDLVEAFGTGTATGGTFSLSAPRIDISQGSGTAWTTAQRVDDLTATTGQVLDLYAPLFADYGFSSINLTATGPVESFATNDVLTVASGTTITAQTRSLELTPGYQTVVTGGSVADLTQVALLPEYQRPAASVALSVSRQNADDLTLGFTGIGDLDIQAGASILTDPLASITLTGQGSVLIGGTLRAPGGTITVSIPTPSGATIDPGYVATQSIDIAPQAVLDVSGTTVLTPNTPGLLLGSPLPGGSVSLTALRGTVVAESGSTIDIAGTSALLDLANIGSAGGYILGTVATSGGSLTVSSAESISLLGNLQARAGVGTTGAAAAGSLEVDLIRPVQPQAGQPFPGNGLEIELVDSTAGQSPGGPSSDMALLGIAQLESWGIDSLTLKAGGEAAPGNVAFDSSLPLTLGREFLVDSPSLSVVGGLSASVTAPYVQLGNSATLGQSATVPTPAAGLGTLTVSAQQINLLGNFALQGIAQATLSSAGDVQLQGTAFNPTGQEVGSIATNGSLAINAERVYPDTYTNFTIASLPGTGGTVSIGSTGASPGTPLSAGGSVGISADKIAISGTLLAPFGSIDLTANDSLTLANGSLLSVSGAGIDVLYGQTEESQAQWIYVVNGVFNAIAGVPTKAVSLTSPNVSVAPSATVNVTGGGALSAYEWVPGTGGTYDALAGPNNFSYNVSVGGTNTTVGNLFPGLYAILPGAAGQPAPYDPQESTSTTQTQTVYLSGDAGIAAGYYALLPARYALEPGALLIQVESGYTSVTGGQIGTLANGVPVIAGYQSSIGSGLHSGTTEYSGFAIYPSGYAQDLANYTITDASTYFSSTAAAAGAPAVPITADAGSFALSITPALSNTLNLQGSVLTAAASGGVGAQVNISAPNLEIIGAGGSGASGSIAVSGGLLQSWNASQLTLGGTSSSGTTTSASGVVGNTATIAVTANSVTVDSGVSLTADQLDLVAQQSIDVKSGATLSSTSGKAGTVLTTLPALQTVTLTDANGNALPQGALLAVSDLNLPAVSRAPPNGTTAASITLETGATLQSGGALALDAPGNVSIADGTIGGKGASWSLSSSSVAFIGSGMASNDTLNIDASLVAALQQAGAVRIASAGAIDILAPLTLGATAGAGPTLNSLTLIGAAINNNAGGNSVLGAVNLTLEGPSTNLSAQATAGSANSLTLVADTLTVGPGTLAVNGFANSTAQVAGAVTTSGYGGLLVGGDLTMNAVELTSAPDATDLGGTLLGTSAIGATGNLTIGAPTTASANIPLPSLVGGDLTLTAGGNLDDAGTIVVPAGVIMLNAGGNLHLANTASISAAGTLLQAVNQSAAVPGGVVTLTGGGNVILDAGTKISVAGVSGAGEPTAPAGSLSITSGATADISANAALLGGASTTGGSFTVDAAALAHGFTPLATSLEAGGFSDAINVRVRAGDLDLAAGTTLSANNLTLTADAGSVNIAGVLNAPSGSERGVIDLSAGNAVTLSGGLHADGSGIVGRGGEIDINTIGSITLDSGSVITTLGAAQMGELVLRAPVWVNTAGANDVAINESTAAGVPNGIGADVSQAGQVIIEPVMVFQSGPATAANAAQITAELSNDIAMAATNLSLAGGNIGARLSSAKNPISVQAGVEFQDANAGDTLTLNTIDLSQYSQSATPQVIDLTVRAAGSVNIDGTISDGYVPFGLTHQDLTQLGQNSSGSLSFVAGADLSSANPLSIVAGSSADLTLGASGTGRTAVVSLVRTGTGDLDLVASGNVVFDAGTSAYTAGEATAAAPPVELFGSTVRLINFGAYGGNVLVSAGGSVEGSPVAGDSGNFTVTGWQVREVNSNQASYGVNLAAFDWNIGSLGGGDVTVTAGANLTNVSAAVADSLVAPASSATASSTLIGAGGGLKLTAGDDVGSAQVYLADGAGSVTASGGVTAAPGLVSSAGNPVGSSIALGNSQMMVWARQSVQIDDVYNPTFIPQSSASGNVSGNGAIGAAEFFTYGSASALSLSSTDGNVTVDPLEYNLIALAGSKVYTEAGSNLFDMPANVVIQAPQQDINLSGFGEIMFPSSTGQLTLFAGQDITGGSLSMSDSLPSSLPTAANPGGVAATGYLTQGGLADFDGVIHAGDASPALITAGLDIVGLSLSIPKAAQVIAGRDILDFGYQGQNISVNDTTLIAAGRDLDYSADSSGAIILNGPGNLDVLAGRNVNLGSGGGIVTQGNLGNANLASAAGANVNLMVGYGTAGADLSGFLKTIVLPSTTYQSQLVSYVEAQTGDTGLSAGQADAAFSALDTDQQSSFIDNVFFNELLLSGRAANGTTGVGFAEGYAAIDALFPYSRNPTAAHPNPYDGKLDMISSQIYTDSGGNISILVPNGGIDVGLAFAPPNFPQKSASQLGIVAEGAGNVDIYATDDVNVNASRIFTLGGGNILIWSTFGSIDAGNGSKSSLSVPPPVVLINQQGQISLDFAGSLTAGSGIRTIQTNPDVAPGNVDLDAPVGTVNAGDAGIGAAGNINIAAAHVIGVDNINFGGTATGVPSDVSSLGATLSGVSAVANASTSNSTNSFEEANNAAKEAAPLAQTALSWLDVFVTGLGEENCKPDDMPCLARQKKASAQ